MGNPHLKRHLLLRWEREQKAREDNRQEDEQPLQQKQDQPHNQEIQGLTTRSNESQPSPEQSVEPELSFEEWLKSQTSSDELTESTTSVATGQARSPKRRTSASATSETFTGEKSGKEENLDEAGRKKAQTQNVGHITVGSKGKPLRKHDKDSDSPDDDFSFPVQGSHPSKNQQAFVVIDCQSSLMSSSK